MVALSNTTLTNQWLLTYDKGYYMSGEKVNPRRLSNGQIFDTLNELENFCREQGFRFDPSDAWNVRSFVWQQFSKMQLGKNFRNNWLDELSRINGRRSFN